MDTGIQEGGFRQMGVRQRVFFARAEALTEEHNEEEACQEPVRDANDNEERRI